MTHEFLCFTSQFLDKTENQNCILIFYFKLLKKGNGTFGTQIHRLFSQKTFFFGLKCLTSRHV